mmetsp:Transcript_42591/g.84292  ORF Transcript_42591/g.84292 Transcript_42591/m.84292 type:complete len:95 (+) Transcript_42591:483-767(+)
MPFSCGLLPPRAPTNLSCTPISNQSSKQSCQKTYALQAVDQQSNVLATLQHSCVAAALVGLRKQPRPSMVFHKATATLLSKLSKKKGIGSVCFR